MEPHELIEHLTCNLDDITVTLAISGVAYSLVVQRRLRIGAVYRDPSGRCHTMLQCCDESGREPGLHINPLILWLAGTCHHVRVLPHV